MSKIPLDIDAMVDEPEQTTIEWNALIVGLLHRTAVGAGDLNMCQEVAELLLQVLGARRTLKAVLTMMFDSRISW